MRTSFVNGLKVGSALSLAAMVAAGFGFGQRRPLVVKGPMKSETRRIGAIDRIVSGEAFQITARVGERPSLVIEAPADLLPHIVARIEGHTLRLSCNTSYSSSEDAPVKVEVTTPNLVGANISGAASLDIRGLVKERRFNAEASGAATILLDADVDTFDLNAAGAAKVKMNSLKTKSLQYRASGAAQFILSGSADNTRIGVSGACVFKGDRFSTHRAEIDSSGACNTEIRVTDSLRAKADGSSHIHYFGRPQVSKSLSGVASITG